MIKQTRERRLCERPIRSNPYKRLPICRLPPQEPLTPGLRRNSTTHAIGFRCELTAESDDSESRGRTK
jgi:hypothetical protein